MSAFNYLVKNTDAWGTAAVKIHEGKAYVQIVFKDQNNNDLPLQKLTFEKDKYPEYLATGKWKLCCNQQKTEIKNAKPLEGKFICKFVEISHEKDQPPKVKSRPDNFRKEGVFLFYTLVWEVVKGDFIGAKITFEVDYTYLVPLAVDWNGKLVTAVGVKYVKGDKSSRHAKATKGFIDALGLFDETPMAYSDNVLPALDKRAKKATLDGKLAEIVVENGYGKSINPVSTSPDLNDFDLSGFDVPAAPSTSNDFPVPVSEPDPFADEQNVVVPQDNDELPWEDAEVPTVDGDGFPE